MIICDFTDVPVGTQVTLWCSIKSISGSIFHKEDKVLFTFESWTYSGNICLSRGAGTNKTYLTFTKNMYENAFRIAYKNDNNLRELKGVEHCVG